MVTQRVMARRFRSVARAMAWLRKRARAGKPVTVLDVAGLGKRTFTIYYFGEEHVA